MGNNLFQYAASNPTTFTDPSGKAPKKYEDQRGRDTAAKRKEMEKNLTLRRNAMRRIRCRNVLKALQRNAGKLPSSITIIQA